MMAFETWGQLMTKERIAQITEEFAKEPAK